MPVQAGVSLTIPLGTQFQFRATGHEPLTMVAITMPPWPGADEAYAVEGPWTTWRVALLRSHRRKYP